MAAIDANAAISGVGNIAGGLGGLLFGGAVTAAQVQGDKAEAEAFGKGAAIEGQNALLADESTNVQKFQLQQKVNKSLGSQQAAVAANGFGEGGTALSLLRESTQNAALAQGGLTLQGQINKNAYLASQASMEGEETAANAAAQAAEAQRSASVFGDIAGIIGGIAKIAAPFVG